MRIEICGGIAAGKTTLTTMLESLGYSCVYEDFSSIAFLDDFYHDPELYTFETELAFLLQHMYQAKKAMQKSDYFICDYSFEQDYAYAKQNLKGREWSIFQSIYNEMQSQIDQASLIINLQCPPKVLQERIQARGRPNEQSITLYYLNGTIIQVENRLKEVLRPLVYINSNINDFRNPEIVREVILPILPKK